MKKIEFIAILYPNRSPSQRFRYEQYIPWLEKNGMECSLRWIINPEDEAAFYKGNLFAKGIVFLKATLRLISICMRIHKPDAIFIQREVYFLGTSFFEKWLSKKAPLIYDFDDSIWMPNISESNKHLAFLKNPKKTEEIIKLSKTIIVGNRFLADYAEQFHKNVVIIPTVVDIEKYIPNPNPISKETITIGWSGSHTTVAHFKKILPVLELLKQKYKERIDFIVIGDPHFEYLPLDIKGKPWCAAHEIEDLYQIDIGIMPLPDDAWSKGKCGFKAIQYMALGIPTVMSPVGVNPEVADFGSAALLATTEAEWLDALSQLIENPALRQQMGTAARSHIVKNYSLQANAEKYLEVIGE